MIDPQRYSLDDAVNYIEHATKKPYSISILLQEAKNDKIRISFIPENRELRYIQLNNDGNQMTPLRCNHLPPKDEINPRYVVIPADKDRYIFTTDLINPEDDKVFPIISRNALLEFARDRKGRISPFKCAALCQDGSSIEIAIVEGKWILNNAELAKWLEERGHPKEYNEGYYYETLSFMEIDRSELCIPAQELNTYIERIKPNEATLECSSMSNVKSNAQNKNKVKKLDRRIDGLKKWLQKNPDFSPHDHTLTRKILWEELSDFDDKIFPPWNGFTQNGSLKTELDGIPKAFFQDGKVKKLISFS